ncbi:mucin-binding protein [Lactobacillus sp. PSON]|uniref:mucin-binding protein n=1 Tax=Lactobacillus sp. PSON TaxID=3455454 RepID=UPI0040414C38
MVSKNNRTQKIEATADHQAHFGIRKLSVGAASVLLSTTLWFSAGTNIAHADTQDSNDNEDNAKAATESNQSANTQQVNKVVVQANDSSTNETTESKVNDNVEKTNNQSVEADANITNNDTNKNSVVAENNSKSELEKSNNEVLTQDAKQNTEKHQAQQVAQTTKNNPTNDIHQAAQDGKNVEKTTNLEKSGNLGKQSVTSDNDNDIDIAKSGLKGSTSDSNTTKTVTDLDTKATSKLAQDSLNVSKAANTNSSKQTDANTKEDAKEYTINIQEVDDTTGEVLRSNNYKGTAGSHNEQIVYNFQGYKLMNPEELEKLNLTSLGGGAGYLVVPDHDIDMTLHFAKLSPTVVKFVDTDGNLLTTYSDSSKWSTSKSAYSDKDNVLDSKFLANAIEIPGYELVENSPKSIEMPINQTYKSKDDPNPMVITFTYKKIAKYAQEGLPDGGGASVTGHDYGSDWSSLPGGVSIDLVYDTYGSGTNDFEGSVKRMEDRYTKQGYTFLGILNDHKNTDKMNRMEIASAVHFLPNKYVTVKYVDENGNELDKSVVLGFNKNNPDQKNQGIDPANHWYPEGDWHTERKEFDGYVLDKVLGSESGKFTSFDYTTTYVYTKAAAAKINYIDDTDNKPLTTDTVNGGVGLAIDYSTKDKIADYEKQGYVFVSDNFTNADGQKFNEDVAKNIFEVHLKHGTIPVTPNDPKTPTDPIDPENPNNPKYPAGVSKDDLNKVVTRTINYVDEYGNSVNGSPEGKSQEVQTVNFTRTAIVDKVTGTLLGYDTDNDGAVDTKDADRAWTPISGEFSEVKSVDPTKLGYVSVDKPVIEKQAISPANNQAISPANNNVVVTVTYYGNQKADIIYRDLDNNNQVLNHAEVSGTTGNKINYSTTDEIKTLTEKGYVLVNDGFNKDAAFDRVKDEDGKASQVFYVDFRHGTTPVDPNHPDSNNPDLSKDALEKTVTRTINYLDSADHSNVLRDPVVDTVTFTASGIIDKVTGKLVNLNNDGTIKDQNGKLTWTYVTSTGKTGSGDSFTFAQTKDQSSINKDGKTYNFVNIDNADYNAGNGAVKSFEANATDSNNLAVNVYYDEEKAPEVGRVTVKYHDDTDNTDIPNIGFDSGDKVVDTPVSYNTNNDLQSLIKKGYVYVNTEGEIPTKITAGLNQVIVHVKHGITTVTPDKPGHPGDPIDPENPTGPRYPSGTSEQDVKRVSTQTIHYVGAGNNTPKDDTQTFTFTREITFDNVNGKIITISSWNENSHKFATKNTPIVQNYHADKKTAGGLVVTPDDLEKEVTVTYVPNGHVVPVDPEGNKIPNVPTPTFPTDPSDPTKVVTVNIPNVPNGYVPLNPENKPGTPISPDPTDSSKDVNVVFTTQNTITVVFHDDTTGQDLTGYGYVSGEENVGTQDNKVVPKVQNDLTTLTNKGYEFINVTGNGNVSYANVSDIPTIISKDAQNYVVHIRHSIIPVDPTNPLDPTKPVNPQDPSSPNYPSGANENDLTKTVTRTVTYVGAGDATPQTVKDSLTFTANSYFDKVTGKFVDKDGKEVDQSNPLTWTIVNGNSDNGSFDLVPTKSISGYTASVPNEYNDGNNNVKKITNITHNSANINVTVTYTKNPDHVQHASVIYQDINDPQHVIVLHTDKDLTGEAGDKINYSPESVITSLTKKGYVLLSDGFGENRIFDNNDNEDQVFYVTFKHGITTVTPDKPGHPGDPIDPNNPDGPKYPEGTGLDNLKKTGTQTIHYTGADKKTPKDNVQSFDFTKKITFDNVTGEIIDKGSWNVTSHEFGTVETPVVDGYHADKRVAGGKTVTPDNLKAEVTVTYTENGKIVPVDPEGNKIPNVPTPQYPTDPSDPTRVTPNEPVPSIPGYTPEVPTVTPDNPGKDTPVIYTPIPADKGQVIVKVHDNTTGKDIPDYGYDSGEQEVGQKVDYNKNEVITNLTNKGYKVINPDVTIPSDITKGSQVVTIYVEHDTVPVNPTNPGKPGEPINPNDPDGPKWPSESGDVSKDVTRTITFVDDNGKEVHAPVEQTVHFTAQGVMDKVTGKWVTPLTWSPDQTVSGQNVPFVENYHVTSISKDGEGTSSIKSVTLNHDSDSYKVVVSYEPNGHIVPVDPNGNKIPNVDNPTYPTDPNNPAKVTPNEPVPSIPGYTPEVPTVTPDNPGEDTPVIYTPIPADKGQVIVKVHDNTTGKDIPDYGYDSGEQKVGQKVDYNKNEVITNLTNKGYKVINPDVTIPSDITKGSQVVTIYVEHTTTPVTPTPEPSVTTVVGKQTITFVDGDNNNTPLRDSDVQTHTFTITDGVPSENSYTFGTVNVPVIKGYVAEIKTAGGKTVTPNDPNANVVVVYHKIGKIVPVDPDHNPIPGAETPQYKNDPNDPTKVVPDENVPIIEGYTPSQSTVTPEDPTKDTEVVYTKKTTPETPSTPQEPEPNVPSPQPHPQVTPDEPEEPTTPTEPEVPDTPQPKTDETVKPHEQDNKEPDEDDTVKPHSEKDNQTNTVRPHSQNNNKVKTVKPHGVKVSKASTGLIQHEEVTSTNSNNINKTKTTLPQTGENNSEETSAAILGAAAAGIGMIGLAGVKKRKRS